MSLVPEEANKNYLKKIVLKKVVAEIQRYEKEDIRKKGGGGSLTFRTNLKINNTTQYFKK